MRKNAFHRAGALLLASFCVLPASAFADDSADLQMPVELKADKPVLDATPVPKKTTQLFGSAQQEGAEPIVRHDHQPVEVWHAGKMRPVRPAVVEVKDNPDKMPQLKAQDARADKQKILQAHDVWFRIPKWMAGSWQTKDKILLAEVNLRTGREQPQRQLKFGYCFEPYGLQQDAHGAYWQFEKVGGIPSNYHIDKKGVGHFNAVDSYLPISSTNTQLVLQKNWHTASIDPATNEILSSRYMQSILTFNLTGPDEINVQEAITTLGKEGEPIYRRITQTVRCRVEPFKPIATLKGHDVRASFEQYMVAR